MRTVRMSCELHLFLRIKQQGILKLPPNIFQHGLRLLRAPSLATSRIALPTTGHALAYALGPQTDSVEAASDIHDDAHDFTVVGAFEGLANSGEHDVQPEGVDGCCFALETVGPFAAVLVLRVFPLGPDAALEEMVVGFKG